MTPSKNWSLYVGIAIPILMVIFVALSIYIPQLFIRPQYSFLYTANSLDYKNHYAVEGGRLTKVSVPNTDPIYYQPNYYRADDPPLYQYDMAANFSKVITFEEAQRLSLDPNRLSPDGFQVVQGGGDGGFFPFYYEGNYTYNTVYLQGRGMRKKLDIDDTNYSFEFLGWIK